jgi:hypothetical protein
MRLLVHPFIFALLPVVSLLSTNIESVEIRHSVRAGILALLGMALLGLILKALLGDSHRAGIIASTVVLIFFTYGYMQDFVLAPFVGERIPSGKLHVPLTILLIGLVALLIWTTARTHLDLKRATGLLNVIALAVLIVPVAKILRHELAIQRSGTEERSIEVGSFSIPKRLPDIYYIVVDGYGRDDVLMDIYELDNSLLIQFLEDQGFVVATKSMSNYGLTHLALAASLNMSYLDPLVAEAGTQSENHRPVAALVKNSLVEQIVKELGYKVVAAETGYRRTELNNADYFLRMPQGATNPFEAILIEHSALRAVLDIIGQLRGERWYPGYQAHSDLVLFLLDQLTKVPEFEEPIFAFVHIFSPHPPFIFSADGSEVIQRYPYSTQDGNHYPGSSTEYSEGYRGQIEFMNVQLKAVITEIMEEYDDPPIIVIQGDHGPGSMVNWDDISRTNLAERMPILNAILLPSVEQAEISPTISPVNTFRIVFNRIFDANFELLEDRSYFSSWRRPYDFVEASTNDL